MSTHAILSPSSAHRWLHCAAAPLMEKGLPETSSAYADEGTQAHTLAATILLANDRTVGALDEMGEFVQVYTDYVQSLDGIRYVERPLKIGHLTGEAGAEGTPDAIVIVGNTLYVIDLKYGRGVLVAAEKNEQLALYALAALDEYDLLGEIENVVLVISQPRVQREPSVWQTTVADLQAFKANVVQRGRKALKLYNGEADVIDSDFHASESTCKWCKHKANCKAAAAKVQELVEHDFEDLTTVTPAELVATYDAETLALKLAAVGLVEDWAAAVREEAHNRGVQCVAIPGFKLVAGKKGARAWANADEAEQVLKVMRLKHEELYDYKVISPTTAEKLHKAGIIGPRQWPKVQALITQAEGKPTLVHESDKRPALTPVIEQFDDLTVEDLI